jgi:hypothetical protein
VRRKGARRLITLVVVVAVVSFAAGYFVMIRFIG